MNATDVSSSRNVDFSQKASVLEKAVTFIISRQRLRVAEQDESCESNRVVLLDLQTT